MLIVAGGISIAWPGNEVLDSTEILDYSTKTSWVQVAVLPSARGNVFAATVGNIFYVTGGNQADIITSGPIVSYDPESDSWRDEGTMTMGRFYHSGTPVSLDAMKIFCPEL